MINRTKNVAHFSYDNFISRFDQSRILVSIYKKYYQKLNGESLIKLLISLGPPRFIWHSKPIINPDGNVLGRSMGILNQDDYSTSIAPTNIGDLWMNFRIWGVIVGLFILGIIFRFLYYILIKNSGASVVGVAIYGVVWIQIIKGSEDWIAPVYAGLIKLFIIMLLGYIFLTYNRDHQ